MSDIINIPAVENSTLLAQNQLLTAQNEILQAQTEQLTTIARNLTSLIVSGITLKGTIGTGGTVTALPSSHGKGDAYIVISAGTYAGASCAIGDVLVALGTSGTSASDWSRIAGFMASDGAAKYAIENYTGSSLLGTNQTIVSAFNALNSKLLVQSGGNITSSNVDSLTTPAIYSRYIEANNITGVSTAGGAFGLFIVTNSNTAERVGQYMFMPQNGYFAMRYKSGSSWSAWRGMQMPVLS